MRKPGLVDTLLLDLDGTLVDSLPDLAAALAPVLAAHGFDPLPPASVRPMIGDGLAVLVARAFAARGAVADADAVRDVIATYERDPASRSVLYPGAAAALDAARDAGFSLAVCTNKPERAARALLDALGIGDRFAAVVGGDAPFPRKPDPAHLLGTLARAGGTPARAVMVGDHRNDVRAAAGAGVRSIFALWGYGDAGDGIAPDRSAARWDEVVPLARALLA